MSFEMSDVSSSVFSECMCLVEGSGAPFPIMTNCALFFADESLDEGLPTKPLSWDIGDVSHQDRRCKVICFCTVSAAQERR